MLSFIKWRGEHVLCATALLHQEETRACAERAGRRPADGVSRTQMARPSWTRTAAWGGMGRQGPGYEPDKGRDMSLTRAGI